MNSHFNYKKTSKLTHGFIPWPLILGIIIISSTGLFVYKVWYTQSDIINENNVRIETATTTNSYIDIVRIYEKHKLQKNIVPGILPYTIAYMSTTSRHDGRPTLFIEIDSLEEKIYSTDGTILDSAWNDTEKDIEKLISHVRSVYGSWLTLGICDSRKALDIYYGAYNDISIYSQKHPNYKDTVFSPNEEVLVTKHCIVQYDGAGAQGELRTINYFPFALPWHEVYGRYVIQKQIQ